MISPAAFIRLLKSEFENIGEAETAEAQRQYMRGQFEFYGIKSKPRREIVKKLIKAEGAFSGQDLQLFADLCYGEPARDLHYAALQMIEKAIKKQEESFIGTLEFLIIENSWWDTVDWIAKLVGIHFLRFPHLIQPFTGTWIESDNMWLQRVALIFQLFYKEKTDTDLLFDYILRHQYSEEFFIRKAMGWALRQYSRTDPEAVRAFIEENELPSLTVKEGLRLMK